VFSIECVLHRMISEERPGKVVKCWEARAGKNAGRGRGRRLWRGRCEKLHQESTFAFAGV
jgi:hypothetical protein